MATKSRTITTLEMSSQGGFVIGHQGTAVSRATEPLETSTAGLVHQVVGVTADSASALTIYDAATDLPATWKKLWFWADLGCRLQLITAATNVEIAVAINDPFVMSVGSLLAAADTSKITNNTDSLAAITQIVIGVGALTNYRLILIL